MGARRVGNTYPTLPPSLASPINSAIAHFENRIMPDPGRPSSFRAFPRTWPQAHEIASQLISYSVSPIHLVRWFDPACPMTRRGNMRRHVVSDVAFLSWFLGQQGLINPRLSGYEILLVVGPLYQPVRSEARALRPPPSAPLFPGCRLLHSKRCLTRGFAQHVSTAFTGDAVKRQWE